MKICGIVAEYNPFHNGHAYHVQRAREQTQADVIVAVMSGNFLQRGEPAIIDKWHRAQAAVANGVDLVVELPFEWAVQSADFFAKGAVKILSDLQCTSLCFGSDYGDDFDYQQFGQQYLENQLKINETLKKLTDQRLSYAQKMMISLSENLPDIQFEENQPNHMLALSYAKENAELREPMKLVSVARKTASYHSTDLQGTIASATAIRQAIRKRQNIHEFVPMQTADLLASESFIDWEEIWPFLKYRLQMDSIFQLQQVYQMVNGMEYRMKKKANESHSFSEFISNTISKRYVKPRIQRLCLYTLLNISEEQMATQWQQTAIRPLAYNKKGQAFLASKLIQKKPVVARFAKKEAEIYPMTLKADRLYQLLNPQIKEQNFGRYAYLIDNS